VRRCSFLVPFAALAFNGTPAAASDIDEEIAQFHAICVQDRPGVEESARRARAMGWRIQPNVRIQATPGTPVPEHRMAVTVLSGHDMALVLMRQDDGTPAPQPCSIVANIHQPPSMDELAASLSARLGSNAAERPPAAQGEVLRWALAPDFAVTAVITRRPRSSVSLSVHRGAGAADQ